MFNSLKNILRYSITLRNLSCMLVVTANATSSKMTYNKIRLEARDLL